MDTPLLIGRFDQTTRVIIEQRWPIVRRHLIDWLDRDEQQTPLLEGVSLTPFLREWLQSLEQRISTGGRQGLIAFQNGWQNWCQSYLLPVASDLGFYEQATHSTLQTLWGRGLFDKPQASSTRIRIIVVSQPLIRPLFQTIIEQVPIVLNMAASAHQRRTLLIERNLCRDKGTADAVLEACDRQNWRSLISVRACGLARKVIVGLRDQGLVGLLNASAHPLVDELLLIEARRPTIAQLVSDADTEDVLTQLRTTVTALHAAISDVNKETLPHAAEDDRGRIFSYLGFPYMLKPSKLSKHNARTKDRSPLLRWEADLLHQPRNSAYRVRSRQTLNDSSSLRERIIGRIAERLGCPANRAAVCLDDLIDGGLDALIDRCCNAPSGTTLLNRLTGFADKQISALVADAREEVLNALADLQRAMTEVMPGAGVPASEELSEDELYAQAFIYAQQQSNSEMAIAPLSLNTLLNAPVGGGRRYRVSARLSIGVAHLSQAKSRRRRKSRALRLFRRGRPSLHPRVVSPRDKNLQAIIERFAELRGLPIRRATDRIRAVVTYGVIGFLSRSSWPQVIDPRLVDYIQLFKFGRLDGTIDWSQISQHLSRVGAHNQPVVLSTSVIRAVAASFPKDRRWPGGAGSAVADVQWQVVQQRSAKPRLHRLWRVLPISLEHIRRSQRFDQGWFAVVVLDMACGRPVGVWTQRGRPGLEAVSLALYQSIWHPGAPDWPLRGIPEVIEIDEHLLDGAMDDLHAAASCLMAEVRVVPSYRERPLWERLEEFRTSTEAEKRYRLRFADQLIWNLLPTFGRELFSKVDRNQDVSRVVQDGVLRYLRYGRGLDDTTQAFFGHRSAPVPAFITETGLLMPGCRTPAAGWLLPMTGKVQTRRDSITIDSIRYSSQWFQCEPGLTVTTRAFPYLYAEMQRGLFVQWDGEPLWLNTTTKEAGNV